MNPSKKLERFLAVRQAMKKGKLRIPGMSEAMREELQRIGKEKEQAQKGLFADWDLQQKPEIIPTQTDVEFYCSITHEIGTLLECCKCEAIFRFDHGELSYLFEMMKTGERCLSEIISVNYVCPSCKETIGEPKNMTVDDFLGLSNCVIKDGEDQHE